MNDPNLESAKQVISETFGEADCEFLGDDYNADTGELTINVNIKFIPKIVQHDCLEKS